MSSLLEVAHMGTQQVIKVFLLKIANEFTMNVLKASYVVLGTQYFVNSRINTGMYLPPLVLRMVV